MIEEITLSETEARTNMGRGEADENKRILELLY